MKLSRTASPPSATPKPVGPSKCFLDEWQNLAVDFDWSIADIFDLPRNGASGLAYWLGTETGHVLGSAHAVTEASRVFDRITRLGWVNPYAAELKQ